MAALARQIISANTALGSALSDRSPKLAEVVLRRECSRRTLFANGACTVEKFALGAMVILNHSGHLAQQAAASSREDTNFVYLIIAASAIVLDSASWAVSSCGNLTTHAALASHNVAVQQLLETLVILEKAQSPALNVLRATTCIPDAIAGCIGRLFPVELSNPLLGEARLAAGRLAADPELLWRAS